MKQLHNLINLKKSRRKFISNLSSFAATVGFSSFFSSAQGQGFLEEFELKNHLSAEQLTEDEEFWRKIRSAYTISPTIINLNNGGVSPSPKVVQEAVEHYNRLANELPSFHLNRTINKGKETVRRKLAELAGCDTEEIAIHRNATESLENVIFGLTLKKGDEVVLSKYDYPSIISSWKQRALRDGIKLKWVDFEFPMEDKSKIVDAFAEKFSKKTKVVNITHMINWTGQILPVKEIAAAAKRKNITVLVDAAHTFCHLDFKIPDLNCDYLGTSLHKWLCAPFGTGMLFAKKDKIKDVYPLFGTAEPLSDDIRKFEHIGTRSTGVEQAIAHAIDFHQLIGIKRKSERLFYLKNYLLEGLANIPRITNKTSKRKDFGGAIAYFEIEGIENIHQVTSNLLHKHQIHTVGMVHENIKGVRATPNVYTLKSEIDRFIEVMEKEYK